MRDLVQVLLVVLGLTALALMVGLVLLRVLREARQARKAVQNRELREVILTALMGEPDEAARARTDLLGRSAPGLEDQAFAMMPKIKGDSHDALVTLLLSKGAAAHATDLARSRSQVRRARGAYRLGALGQPDSLSLLFGLSRDKAFLVRRMAVRALGQVGDPLAVAPLLDALAADQRLTRDVLAALGRIGPVAAPALRRELRRRLAEPADDRRAALTAMGLGLLGDVSAVPLLVSALDDRGQPGLAEAAADALGAMGSPEAVGPLLGALADGSADLRLAAAHAVGSIGDPCASGPLGDALRGSDHHLASRAAAGALLRLGDCGLRVLGESSSPYAAEALAVHRVRTGV